MRRDLIHSAEGTHWTKKNHKYIRKEGNRYIYADDLKTGRASREQIGARQYKTEQGIRERSQAQRRQDASNGVGARNQEFAKAQSSLQRTKQLYKSTGGKVPMEYKVGGMTLKRASTPIPDTAVEKAKAITQQRNRAANGNGARNQQYAKAQNARQAVNRQGSNTKGYNYAKKENDWRQYQPGTISAKRKRAMYLQGIGNGVWRDPQTADQAKNLNEFRSNFMGAKVQDYSRSVKANKGKEFVNKLKANLGEISAKKDRLAKKAKDFFHKIGAKYEEARYLKPQYDENSGRPKSHSKYERITNDDSNAKLGSTTGNFGGGNLRVGVEAGRRRAGIKKSGNVQGLENNLRNKGYNASTDANWENNMDNFHGSYGKKDLYRLDGTSYNDWHATRQKHDNEAVRQNLDRHNSRINDRPDELTRGTKAGRQRVNRNKAVKAANGNGAKNQQHAKHVSNSRGHYGLENGRANKSRIKDVHVSYAPNSYNEYKSNDQSRAVEETRTRKEKKNKKK